MREENFWCKKPRYSEVRVIARRVIARYRYKATTDETEIRERRAEPRNCIFNFKFNNKSFFFSWFGKTPKKLGVGWQSLVLGICTFVVTTRRQETTKENLKRTCPDPCSCTIGTTTNRPRFEILDSRFRDSIPYSLFTSYHQSSVTLYAIKAMFLYPFLFTNSLSDKLKLKIKFKFEIELYRFENI